MTEKEVAEHLVGLVTMGFAVTHPNGSFSLTKSGMDYVEKVVLKHVTEPMEIYSIGYQQGLTDGKKKSH